MNYRIAVLTGDGCTPGMNAAIRSVTRRAVEQGWQVIGICDGDGDLLPEDFIPLTVRTVDGISHRSGSLLGCSDTEQFLTEAGQKIAQRYFTETRVDALIAIGGLETQAAAQALMKMGIPVNGIAVSVENDMAGFDMTIGVDSALNVALDKIDCLRSSRSTGNALHIVEVVGRTSGYLALMSAVVGGAAAVIIPEIEATYEQLASAVANVDESGDPVIVAAEGVYDANHLRSYFASHDPAGKKPQEHRLAHVQRHAAPSAYDRLLGTRLGAQSVEALARGETGVVLGMYHGETRAVPFSEVVGKTSELDNELLHLATLLTGSAAAQEH